MFREKPYRGKWINVDENGFRYVKNQGPWPPDPNSFVVFVLGGSTTFGYGLPDHQTIPSWLQEYLNQNRCEKPVHVYNFGRSDYHSIQERILLETLIQSGYLPNLVVFIDGLNDFYRAADDSVEERFQRLVNESKNFWAGVGIIIQSSPVAELTEDIRQRVMPKSEFSPSQVDEGLLQSTIEKWLRNKKIIESIGKAFDIEVLFVWQPVPLYGYDLQYHIMFDYKNPHGTQPEIKYGYELASKIINRELDFAEDNILWLADMQRDQREPLYVDQVHYTSKFSKEIAKEISQRIMNRDLDGKSRRK